jgi:hypothetical protein
MAVSGIDEMALPVDTELVRTVTRLSEDAPGLRSHGSGLLGIRVAPHGVGLQGEEDRGSAEDQAAGLVGGFGDSGFDGLDLLFGGVDDDLVVQKEHQPRAGAAVATVTECGEAAAQ